MNGELPLSKFEKKRSHASFMNKWINKNTKQRKKVESEIRTTKIWNFSLYQNEHLIHGNLGKFSLISHLHFCTLNASIIIQLGIFPPALTDLLHLRKSAITSHPDRLSCNNTIGEGMRIS